MHEHLTQGTTMHDATQQDAAARLADAVAAANDLRAALERLTRQCERLRLPGERKSAAEENAEAVLARFGAA